MDNFDINKFENGSERSQELTIKRVMLRKILGKIDYNLEPEEFTKLRQEIRDMSGFDLRQKQKINRTIGNIYWKKNAYKIIKNCIKLIDDEDDLKLSDYLFEAHPYLKNINQDPYSEQFLFREIENYIIEQLKKEYNQKVFSALYFLNRIGYSDRLERVERHFGEFDDMVKYLFEKRYKKYLSNQISDPTTGRFVGDLTEAIDVNKFEKGTEQSQEWEIKKHIIRKELDRIDFDFGPKFFIEHIRNVIIKATKNAFPQRPGSQFDNQHNRRVKKFQSKLEQILCKKYYENNKERLLKLAQAKQGQEQSYITYFLTYIKDDNQYREKFIEAFIRILTDQTYNFFNHSGNYSQAASTRDSFYTNTAIIFGWLNELEYHQEIKRYIELIYDNTKGEINREFRNKMLRLHSEYMNNYLAPDVTELARYYNKIVESKDFDSMSPEEQEEEIKIKMLFKYLNEPTDNNDWTSENLFKGAKNKFDVKAFDTVKLFKKYGKEKELINYIVRRLKETKGRTESHSLRYDGYLNKHDFLLACMCLNQMNYGKRIPEIEFNLVNDPVKQEYYDAMVDNRDVDSEVHK